MADGRPRDLAALGVPVDQAFAVLRERLHAPRLRHVDPEFGPLADTDRGQQSAAILARPVLGEIDGDELQGSDYLNLGRRWGDGSADRRLGEQVSIRSIRAGSIPGGWT